MTTARRAALLLCALGLLGADKPKRRATAPIPPATATNPSPTPEPQQPYAEGPLDPALSQLPPHYRGVSFERLFSSAQKTPKGEFETTAQYQARTSGPSKIQGTYGLMFDKGSHCFFKYDADAQAFNLSLYPDLGVSIGFESRDFGRSALEIAERRLSTREFVASNSFGAKATVTESSDEVLAVIPTSWAKRTGAIKASVAVPLAEAPAVKPMIRAMAVVSFSGSGESVTTGTYFIEATISAPLQIIKHYKYIRADLLSIWIYNFETGAVLAKLEP